MQKRGSMVTSYRSHSAESIRSGCTSSSVLRYCPPELMNVDFRNCTYGRDICKTLYVTVYRVNLVIHSHLFRLRFLQVLQRSSESFIS